MMPTVDIFIEHLRKPAGERFENAIQAIEDAGAEKWVMKEVVGYAVDIPRDADRVNQPEWNQNPPGKMAEREKNE
jgi:hypothetical protein